MTFQKYQTPKFRDIDESIKLNSDLNDFYREQERIRWTEEELETKHCKKDLDEFEKLPKEYKNLIKSILLFFTVADKTVINNLEKIISEIPTTYKSAKYFYLLQNNIEAVHDKSYDRAAVYYYNNDDLFIKDRKLLDIIMEKAREDKDFDMNNFSHEHYDNKDEEEKLIFKAVALKINLMNKWEHDDSLIHRLVAFFVLETIGFNPIFALINNFKTDNNGLKYLIEINELVSRDEKIHAEFGIHFYLNYILNPLSDKEVLKIIKEIADIEIKFLEMMFPKNITIYTKNVSDYINFTKKIANNLASILKLENIYNDVLQTNNEFNIPQLKLKINQFERTSIYTVCNRTVNRKYIINALEIH